MHTSVTRNYKISLPFIKLAIREWGPIEGYPVIAIHGWLDNLETFTPLAGDAGWLYDARIRLITVDLAGHGHSQHRNKGQNYVFLDYVDDLHQLIQALSLTDKPILMGHSMGGGVATIYAGTEVANLAGLVLIESLGPVSNLPQQAPQQLSKHLMQRHRHRSQIPAIYDNLDTLVKTRETSTGLSQEYVRLILERNMIKTKRGYQWRSDPRLRIPSAMYLSDAQVDAFVSCIHCETLIIRADDNANASYPVLGERANLLVNKQIKSCTGGHHLHMTNAVKVRQHILEYLTKTIS